MSNDVMKKVAEYLERKVPVSVYYNDENGDWVWAVTVDEYPEFWLNAFKSKSDALRYCLSHGLTITTVILQKGAIMKQIRKMSISLTIESSKTKPFKLIGCSACVNNDKFLLVRGKEISPSEVSNAIYNILSPVLESNILSGTGKKRRAD